MELVVDRIAEWMRCNRLRLNFEKTDFLWYATRRRCIHLDTAELSVCGALIRPSTSVTAFVTSRVDRWNSLLAGAPACLMEGPQLVLNVAARLICNRRKYDHVTPLLRDVLHWLPVPFRIEYKLCLVVFLSLHGAAPESSRDCCTGTLIPLNPGYGCDHTI